jgi:hypothetical protein
MRTSRYVRTTRRRGGAWHRGSFRLKALCICGVGLVAAAGLALLIWPPSPGTATTGPTPTCEAPLRVRVFVMDSSDPAISPSQAAAIDTLVQRFLDEGRRGDRVMVGRLTTNMAMPLEILWVGCDPGQEFEHSQWQKSPREARMSREKLLIAHVRAAVESAKAPSPMPLSPIAESWSMLVKDQRMRGSAPDVARIVYYVTDALEHHPLPLPSAYRRELNRPKAKAYFASFVTGITSTKVTIGLLYRPEHKAIQENEAKPWLESFLKKSGVEAIEWVPLW